MADVADGELRPDAGTGASFHPLCTRGADLSCRPLSGRNAASAPRPRRTAARGRLSGRGTFGRRNRMLRSEEHTSELQYLMSISYAALCLKKKKHKTRTNVNI